MCPLCIHIRTAGPLHSPLQCNPPFDEHHGDSYRPSQSRDHHASWRCIFPEIIPALGAVVVLNPSCNHHIMLYIKPNRKATQHTGSFLSERWEWECGQHVKLQDNEGEWKIHFHISSTWLGHVSFISWSYWGTYVARVLWCWVREVTLMCIPLTRW